jgi:hypothetical protein
MIRGDSLVNLDAWVPARNFEGSRRSRPELVPSRKLVAGAGWSQIWVARVVLNPSGETKAHPHGLRTTRATHQTVETRAVYARAAQTPGVRATTPTRRASEGSGAGRVLPRSRVGLVWAVRRPGVNRSNEESQNLAVRRLAAALGRRPTREQAPVLQSAATPTRSDGFVNLDNFVKIYRPRSGPSL